MLRLLKVYIFLLFLFLYIPIFLLIFYSFNQDGNMIEFTGFTLKWYQELFSNKDLLIIIINTLVIALLSSLISVILGFIGANTIMNIKNKKTKYYITILNSIFLVSPDVIIGISLLSLFSLASLKLGFLTVLLSHIAFSVPVSIIIILAKLKSINKNIINAARDLGANDKNILNLILLPLIRPAIVASFITSFTYSLDDFAVTFFVTGNGFSTLAINIYSQARQGISMEINALSSIIFLITIFIALIYYLYENNKLKRRK